MNKIKSIFDRAVSFVFLLLLIVWDFIKNNAIKLLVALLFAIVLAGALIKTRNVSASKEVARGVMCRVSMHIRTLPQGYHHSPAKAKEAAKLGIKLASNQTIVDAYVKNV